MARSSSLIPLESEDCETCNEFAAPVTEPFSATASKYSNWRNV
jgi:hypothetical protein